MISRIHSRPDIIVQSPTSETITATVVEILKGFEEVDILPQAKMRLRGDKEIVI